ncbi:MAG TPA: hypothetical protein VG778_12535, partial [Blastocatellia bacterium]|nr:hypothetical protein [Blastocatellia bacterium]
MPFTRRVIIAGGAVVALGVAALCGTGHYRGALLVALASITGAAAIILRPSLETILLTWFVTTPVASFAVRFPADDP